MTEQAAAEGPPGTFAGGAEGPIRVLIVEDNPYDAQGVAGLFAGLPGFSVSVAGSLAEAEGRPADVVLLDLNLPDSYGPPTLAACKELFPGLPVIVMTGYYEARLGVDLIKKGAQDYLVKGKITADSLSYSVRYSIERARAESAVRGREELLRGLLEQIPDGILVLRDGGGAVFANRGAELLLGRHREELLARTFEIESDPRRPVETQISGFGGKPIPVEVRETAIQWSGEPCRLVMIRDITVLKQLERTRDDLISRVSHDLRSPLTIVKESISLVSDGTLGPVSGSQQELLKMGLDNVARLNRLIDAVMDITKIEAGVLPMDLAETDLGGLMAGVAKDYFYVAAERRISLRGCPPEEPLRTWCDQDKLREVLANLVSNALKFTPEGGSIKLSLGPWEGKALISVENTGEGIAPEDLPKLFNKFSRLGGERREEAKGTGLGLAISRGIVEMHHGQIWAESEPGSCTRFLVLLPPLSFDGALDLLASREVALAGNRKRFCVLRVLPPGGAAREGGAAPGAEALGLLKERLRSAHASLRGSGGEIFLFLPGGSPAECARLKSSVASGLEKTLDLPAGALAAGVSAWAYPEDFTDAAGLAARLKKA